MLDIITIGTATRDLFLRSKNFDVNKDLRFETGKSMVFEAGAKTEVEELFFETGGGATNSAVSFARIGLKTASCFKIGKDTAGSEIINALCREGVKTCFVKRSASEPTSLSIIFLSPGGERNIFVYRGALIGKTDINFQKLKAKWLYVSSVGGNLELLDCLADFVRERNLKLAFNPGSTELKHGFKKLFNIFNVTKILILNRREASGLMDIPYNFRKTIFRKSCGLTPGMEVITDGKDGAYVVDENQAYQVGVYDWKITDRLGAGDAFGSGFVAGYIKYRDTAKALQYAAFNASSVVTKIGAKAGIVDHFPAKPLKIDITEL